MTLLILVVDDEPDVELLFRQQFRHDLRAGRFTMEFAPSAPAALQRITDAAGVSLILILSDINMPGMSGYAVARELRQRHGPLAPLLIAISGVWTKAADRQLGEAIGFDHYVLKPCDPRELLPLLDPLHGAAVREGNGER